MLRSLLRTLFGLKRALRSDGASRPSAAPLDPRAQDPWLGGLLEALGDRYQLGEEKAQGIQILRRTGRARFNPQLVYVRKDGFHVRGVYEVRGHGDTPEAQARGLLDARVTGPLRERGLAPAAERSEDWGGTVVIREYQGALADARAAAAAVRFFCEESDQVMDTAVEGVE